MHTPRLKSHRGTQPGMGLVKSPPWRGFRGGSEKDHQIDATLEIRKDKIDREARFSGAAIY